MVDPAPPRRTWLRRVLGFGAALGRGPRVVIVVACLAIGVMYCANRDMGGDPKSLRGDGRYRPVLARGDGHLNYLVARSLAFDRDLDYDDELAQFGDPFGGRRTEIGRVGIPHPIGAPLVWTPLVWLAQGGAVVANVFGAGIQDHGYTLWHQRIVFASSVLAAWLAIGLGIAVARRTVGGRWGPAWAGAAILLGTPITYYATYMPSYSHALDAGAAGGFLAAWALTLGRWDWRRVVLVGGLLGLSGLIRSQELALGIVVAIEVVVAAIKAPPKDTQRWRWIARVFGAGAAMAAVAAIVMIPQAIAFDAVYGHWTALPQGPNYTRPAHPLIPELLFAARNGWFSSHPLAYAGVLGLGLLAWRGPRIAPHARLIALGLLAAVAMQVYLNATILDWWAQASFGQRRLCSMTMPLVVGLATWLHQGGVLLARLKRRAWIGHAIAVPVLGWFVVWNLQQVWPLRGGKPAQASVGAACCRRVPSPLSTIAQPIYNVVGNPFALPASAVFAVRYGVPIDRWDRTHGEYPWLPPMDYTRATLRGESALWNLGGAKMQPFIVGGLGPTEGGPGRAIRWTTARRAEVLVPNLIPDRQTLTLWVRPNLAPGVVSKAIVVRWNGDVVARATLTDQQGTVAWTIAGDVGDNLLSIEAALDAPNPIVGMSMPKVPVGVAVGEIRFTAP